MSAPGSPDEYDDVSMNTELSTSGHLRSRPLRDVHTARELAAVLLLGLLVSCSHRTVDPVQRAGTVAEAQHHVHEARRTAVSAAANALESAIEARIAELAAFNRSVERYFHATRAPSPDGTAPPTWTATIPSSMPEQLRDATDTLLRQLERPCLPEQPCRVDQTEAFNAWVNRNRDLNRRIAGDGPHALGYGPSP